MDLSSAVKEIFLLFTSGIMYILERNKSNDLQTT